MNKDVIHIDIEDDITTIIGKIKSSKERIIALVPPRRIGVLQSAVNMRLLARAADSANKRVVLVTGDTVLAGLAATANIPVAKTLQSKPEVAEMPVLSIDDRDDVIDGRSISIGELADSAKKDDSNAVVDAVITENTNQGKSEAVKGSKKSSKQPKIPNFNVFRKKFALIGLAILLLVGFLVWAIVIAPSATIMIAAKTTSATVSEAIDIKFDGTTDAKSNIIKGVKKELNKELSVDFDATGKKNVGEKATGVVRLSNSSRNAVTISSGTILKNNGLSYTLRNSVTVPAATLGWDCPGYSCSGVASASVVAVEGGSQYNAASGSMSISVSGVSASLKSPTSGGTDKTATVVTAQDIEKAKAKLNEQKADSLKTDLEASFDGSVKVIVDSYVEKRSEPASSIAVDAEATGKVSLKTVVTAGMIGIDRKELKNFVEDKIKAELAGKESQKIYDNGIDSVKFSQFSSQNNVDRVRLSVNGKVGPTIDEQRIKEQSKGRSYGEVQSSIESIIGVDAVDVKFSPFWVKTVPGDVNKIKVEFKLNNAG